MTDLRHIIGRLAAFYSSGEVRLWLYSQHRLLADKRPIDFVNDGRADDVLGVIESLDAGAYN